MYVTGLLLAKVTRFNKTCDLRVSIQEIKINAIELFVLAIMTTYSVPSRIPSPSSISSSLVSPTSDWPSAPYFLQIPRDAYRDHSPEERLKPRPSYRKHGRYYFSDGNIIFLVDGVLYNVHRYFFQRDSSNFAAMFISLPHGGCGKGLTDDEPIPLRVTAKDFDLFLSILYPSDFGVHAATTVEDWTGILNLAANWNFTSIKALAIKNLSSIASPIDKIVLGRMHDVKEWLGDAYEAVCLRDDPLTLDDGVRLGMEDVIKISATRQRIDRQPPSPSGLLSNSIRETFGLELIHVPEVPAPAGQGDRESIVEQPPSFQPPEIPLAVEADDSVSEVKSGPQKPLTKAQKKKMEREMMEMMAQAELRFLEAAEAAELRATDWS
jgi:hypothetical protein